MGKLRETTKKVGDTLYTGYSHVPGLGRLTERGKVRRELKHKKEQERSEAIEKERKDLIQKQNQQAPGLQAGSDKGGRLTEFNNYVTNAIISAKKWLLGENTDFMSTLTHPEVIHTLEVGIRKMPGQADATIEKVLKPPFEEKGILKEGTRKDKREELAKSLAAGAVPESLVTDSVLEMIYYMCIGEQGAWDNWKRFNICHPDGIADFTRDLLLEIMLKDELDPSKRPELAGYKAQKMTKDDLIAALDIEEKKICHAVETVDPSYREKADKRRADVAAIFKEEKELIEKLKENHDKADDLKAGLEAMSKKGKDLKDEQKKNYDSEKKLEAELKTTLDDADKLNTELGEVKDDETEKANELRDRLAEVLKKADDLKAELAEVLTKADKLKEELTELVNKAKELKAELKTTLEDALKLKAALKMVHEKSPERFAELSAPHLEIVLSAITRTPGYFCNPPSTAFFELLINASTKKKEANNPDSIFDGSGDYMGEVLNDLAKKPTICDIKNSEEIAKRCGIKRGIADTALIDEFIRNCFGGSGYDALNLSKFFKDFRASAKQVMNAGKDELVTINSGKDEIATDFRVPGLGVAKDTEYARVMEDCDALLKQDLNNARNLETLGQIVNRLAKYESGVLSNERLDALKELKEVYASEAGQAADKPLYPTDAGKKATKADELINRILPDRQIIEVADEAKRLCVAGKEKQAFELVDQFMYEYVKSGQELPREITDGLARLSSSIHEKMMTDPKLSKMKNIPSEIEEAVKQVRALGGLLTDSRYFERMLEDVEKAAKSNLAASQENALLQIRIFQGMHRPGRVKLSGAQEKKFKELLELLKNSRDLADKVKEKKKSVDELNTEVSGLVDALDLKTLFPEENDLDAKLKARCLLEGKEDKALKALQTVSEKANRQGGAQNVLQAAGKLEEILAKRPRISAEITPLEAERLDNQPKAKAAASVFSFSVLDAEIYNTLMEAQRLFSEGKSVKSKEKIDDLVLRMRFPLKKVAEATLERYGKDQSIRRLGYPPPRELIFMQNRYKPEAVAEQSHEKTHSNFIIKWKSRLYVGIMHYPKEIYDWMKKRSTWQQLKDYHRTILFGLPSYLWIKRKYWSLSRAARKANNPQLEARLASEEQKSLASNSDKRYKAHKGKLKTLSLATGAIMSLLYGIGWGWDIPYLQVGPPHPDKSFWRVFTPWKWKNADIFYPNSWKIWRQENWQNISSAREPEKGTEEKIFPQDLAKLSDAQLQILYNVGNVLPEEAKPLNDKESKEDARKRAEESAQKRLEWLRGNIQVQPEGWSAPVFKPGVVPREKPELIPAVLTYFEERMNGSQIIVKKNEKSDDWFVKREKCDEKGNACNDRLQLKRSETDRFLKRLYELANGEKQAKDKTPEQKKEGQKLPEKPEQKKVEKEGQKSAEKQKSEKVQITLQYLRDNSQQWYNEGFLWRDVDYKWNQLLGTTVQDQATFLETNPVFGKFMLSLASKGGHEYHVSSAKGVFEKLLRDAVDSGISRWEAKAVKSAQDTGKRELAQATPSTKKETIQQNMDRQVNAIQQEAKKSRERSAEFLKAFSGAESIDKLKSLSKPIPNEARAVMELAIALSANNPPKEQLEACSHLVPVLKLEKAFLGKVYDKVQSGGYPSAMGALLSVFQADQTEKMLGSAMKEISTKLGEPNIATVSVERNEQLARLLAASGADAYLASLTPDPTREKFFSLVKVHLERGGNDVKVLLTDLDREGLTNEKARLLREAVYERSVFMQTAKTENLLEHKPKEYEERKVTDEKQELMARFRLKDGDIADYVRANLPLQVFLTKLMSKDKSHVLRLSHAEAFVRDIRDEASKTPNKKFEDLLEEFNPTTHPPGKRSEYSVSRGYLIDIKTAKDEESAKKTIEEKEKENMELKKKSEEIKKDIANKETEKEDAVKKKAKYEAELGELKAEIFTSTADRERISILESLIVDYKKKLTEIEAELDTLRPKKKEAEATLKLKTSSTKFWADNSIPAGWVQSMVDDLMKNKGFRESVRRTDGLTDKKKVLGFVLEKIFDNLDKKKFMDKYKLKVVQEEGKSVLKVNYEKESELKDWIKVLFIK